MCIENLEEDKLFSECYLEAIKQNKNCKFPGCNEVAINSHIIQKKGILSKLSSNGHLWEYTIEPFNEVVYKFKRKGLNKIFSFKCFCNKHDTSIFRKIEEGSINFDDYESCLLFKLRTLSYEIFHKDVRIKMYTCYLNNSPKKYDNEEFRQHLKMEESGLVDLLSLETEIWNDYFNKTESFVFKYRAFSEIGICLSTFYTYETTDELEEIFQTFGTFPEPTSEIFISLFPYKDSALMLMSHHKKDTDKVSKYFNDYFENEKTAQIRITNLILFNCDTWLINDDFYQKNVEGIVECYHEALKYSLQNIDERKTVDLNFFEDNFKDKFVNWVRGSN